MYDWDHYVRQYLEANPPGGKRSEGLHQTFVNVCLGQTYEQQGEAPKANQLQKNIRDYPVRRVPERLSVKSDGNGKIVMITCACDLNGKVDDARLDYEVVAWTESGACYAVVHGSIGTFIPLEGSKKKKVDRKHWTYDHHKQNSVWPKFQEALDHIYVTDSGKKMKIFITGIDTGHYTVYAYEFIDKTNSHVVGLKGKDADRYIKFGVDVPSFKPARERGKLYLVEVNQVKDELASMMKLKWDSGNDDQQPSGFMNFPTPSEGLYLYSNYFSHFEAEHRVVETKEGEGVAARWVKKSSIAQNHMWDCFVYNIALRDILMSLICKEYKILKGTWADYVAAILGSNPK